MLQLQKFQLDYLKKTLEYIALGGGVVFSGDQIKKGLKAYSFLSWGEVANIMNVSFQLQLLILVKQGTYCVLIEHL